MGVRPAVHQPRPAGERPARRGMFSVVEGHRVADRHARETPGGGGLAFAALIALPFAVAWLSGRRASRAPR
jgi:hypothetical protein